MFASQSAPKVLLDQSKETVALEKMHIIGGNRKWVAWEAKHRLCIFGINIRNWFSKIYKEFATWFFTFCENFVSKFKKNHEDKTKRLLLTSISMSLICPISNGIFPYQSAPKVLIDPNKDIIIMELYKLHKIGRKSTRSKMQNKNSVFLE